MFELLDTGENYGAMLQLKDVIETIVKTYVSIGLAEIYAKTNKEEKEINILFEFTDDILSLGHWARKISDLMDCNINNTLIDLYDGINDFVFPQNEIDLVHWRNECLGHGALGYLNDKDYWRSFTSVTERVNEFITDYSQYIEKIVIYDDQKRLFAKIDNDITSLYPFITIDEHKVFFFDTYIDSKKLDVLNYYYGIKKTHENNAIYNTVKKIYNDYSHAARSIKLQKEESIENKLFSVQLKELLKKNELVKNSAKATYLETWLNEKTKKYSKGVFLMQLPAGSGKTTCVQQLEKLTKTKININNTETRAIYLNNTYNSSLKRIKQELQCIYNSDKNGRTLLTGDNLPDFNEASKNVKAEIANYINAFYSILREGNYIKSKKLLLVFDGLDELSDLTFYDYIPTYEMLNDDIYILLTTRTNEELSSEKLLKTKKIDVQEVLIPDVEQTVKPLMNEYVFSMNPNLDERTCEQYIDISKNNFAFLNFLATYANIIENDNTPASNMEIAVSSYIKNLQKLYGDKYKKKVLLLLYIFANISFGISLKQLSLVLGEEKISFELIGMMADIAGLIQLDHSRDNLYRVCNAELKAVLAIVINDNKFCDYEKELSEIIINRLESLFNNKTDELIFTSDEYNFIYAIFVCRFQLFLHDLFEYFRGSFLIIIACMLKGTFNDELSLMRSNVFKLYDELHLQSIMYADICEKSEDEDLGKESFYYHLLVKYYESQKIWDDWFRKKALYDDCEDIISEKSDINIVYDELLKCKDMLTKILTIDPSDETKLLYRLFTGRIGLLLQEIQKIYEWLQNADLIIKYSNLIIKIMAESQKRDSNFHPDYALEYRKISKAFEMKGDKKSADRYRLLALKNEESLSMLSPEVSEYIKKRSKTDDFDTIFNNIINDLNEPEDQLLELESIENEIFTLVKEKNYEQEAELLNDIVNCISMESKLAYFYRTREDKNKNLYWRDRTLLLLKIISDEHRELFRTETILKTIDYCNDLIFWREFDKAENIFIEFLTDEDIIEDEYNIGVIGEDEYISASQALNSIRYIIYKIKHPECLKEISKAKKSLTDDALLYCDSIVNDEKNKQNLDLGINTAYFTLISETDQLLCRENVISKKGKNSGEKKFYQFNHQKCRMCEEMSCPSRKAPFRIEL